MSQAKVIVNGRETPVELPCSIEAFLLAQQLLPRSVVVEHNGEAIAPSQFAQRPLAPKDRLEIVCIVAGG
jgi:sulfur carrier protein